MMICKECGYHGKMKKHTKGSFIIEVFLWLMLLVPGIVYSLWRVTSKIKICPKCKSDKIIPLNSPAGKKLAEEYGIPLKNA